ncbi:MAG: hypothetical protein ACREN4_00525 [Candidatus Dormibacteria bacterium]
MGRVAFWRLTSLGRADPSVWCEAVAAFGTTRSWRCEPIWLATDASRGLFEMEYLRHLRLEVHDPVAGAGFVRLAGDETDFLAACFGLLRLTAELGGRVELRDPDNPIRKQRCLTVVEGQLTGPHDIDEVMIAGPIFKRLPASTITFYPPRYRGRTLPGPSGPPRQWSFSLGGLRARAPGFLEAEAEAMRIYRGLAAIG